MTNEIAQTHFVAVLPSGETKKIYIRIGCPRMDPKNAVCPVWLEGIDRRTVDVCGEDLFQALTLAMSYIFKRLDGLEKQLGWRLYLFGDVDDERPICRDCLFPKLQD